MNRRGHKKDSSPKRQSKKNNNRESSSLSCTQQILNKRIVITTLFMLFGSWYNLGGLVEVLRLEDSYLSSDALATTPKTEAEAKKAFESGIASAQKQKLSSLLSSIALPTFTSIPAAVPASIPSYVEGGKVIQLIKDGESFSKSKHTLVTAYFNIRSKYGSDKYDGWMKNMLSLQDPMVIFTSPDLVQKMIDFRKDHASASTLIVPMHLNQTAMAQSHDLQFWEHQLAIDPEARRHAGYKVFWIWLSKSWFTTEAIKHYNFFDSDVFMWSDIGCFRNSQYSNKMVVQHYDVIPQSSILQMAHHKPDPPPYKYWINKLSKTEKHHFYHSGSQLIGYKDTWLEFHKQFLITIDNFVQRDKFIGEDQIVLQTTCLLHPEMCKYAPQSQVNDNHYFGLRWITHTGRKIDYWPSDPLEIERIRQLPLDQGTPQQRLRQRQWPQAQNIKQ